MEAATVGLIRSRDKLFLGFATLAGLALFYPLLLGETFFLRDLTYLFHPWKQFVSENLQREEFPLWNPYLYGGMPAMANLQSGVFYPFSLFFYFFGFPTGLKLYQMGTWIAAGAAGGLLGYVLNGRVGAAWMGLISCMNGYFLGRMEFLSLSGAYPWIFLFGLFLWRGYWTCLALTLALSLFSGYPQMTAIGFCATGVLLVVHRRRLHPLPLRERGSSLEGVRGIGKTMALAATLWAAQGLPSLELWRNSIRAQGVNLEEASEYSMPPWQMIGFIFPAKPWTAHPSKNTGEKYFWGLSAWMGLVSLFLILRKLKENKRGANGLSAISLIFLLIACGSFTPLYALVYHAFPGFALMRYPPQILFAPILLGGFILTGGKFSKAIATGWLLALLELCFHGFGIQATVPDSYFYAKGPVAKTLQENISKKPGRIMLTPYTDSVRRTFTDHMALGWGLMRDRMTGMVSSLYHIENVSGVGEPLQISAHEKKMREIMSAETLATARKSLGDSGVRYILSQNPVSDPSFRLVVKHQLHIYENPAFRPDAAFHRLSAVRAHLELPGLKDEPAHLLKRFFHGYPGWQVAPAKPKGLWFFYHPLSFILGALISAITLAGISLLGLRYAFDKTG